MDNSNGKAIEIKKVRKDKEKDESLSDELLVLQYQKGSDESFNKLFFRYRDPAYSLSNFLYLNHKCKNVTFDDVLAASWEALVFASKKYNSNIVGTFHAYWKEIANNEIKALYHAEGKNHPSFFKSSVSLDDNIGENLTFSDVIADPNQSIIGSINAQEVLAEFNDVLSNECSDLEQLIIKLRINDESFKKIAMQLNMSEKHVRYIYRRAKEKLK